MSVSCAGAGAWRRRRDREQPARRLALRACLSAILLMLAAAPAALAANPIQAENANAGDSYWTAALQDPVPGKPPIEGYGGATSVRPGASITFHVSTNSVARYRVEISRLGWYGGAGGRRMSCLVGSTLDPYCSKDEWGIQQPSAPSPDPATAAIDAGWATTDTLTVPDGWTSGYYLAVFRLTSGPSAGTTGFTPFIVQAPAIDHSAVLVQVPSNTWQAYNRWGGRNLYTTPPAVKVSFDRPYAHRLLFNWEYPLIRFLERGGWDVSYATDDAVDADPSLLLGHTLDMSAGHDEYWTKAMRDGWDAAKNAGVNLAFMGANDSFWQVRYEDGRRTMVGYKYQPDPNPNPTVMTTQFRVLPTPRPECELMGVQFQGTVLSRQYLDYVADPAIATDPWFTGTGLTPGSVLPGLGGYEVDSVTPGCHVPPVTRLLSYSGPSAVSGGSPTTADAVRYTACSGAEVFSAGSLQFSWGLDPWRDRAYSDPLFPPEPPASAGLQLAMTQALADLVQSHVPLPGPPQVCVPTPRFRVPSPWAAVGQPVTLTSTSSDQYGQIASQDWSAASRGSWVAATGPAVTESFHSPGPVSVTLRVTDASGASATLVKTLHICACPVQPAPGLGQTPLSGNAGGPCDLAAIGSVRVVGRRYWFEPHAAGTPLSIATYTLTGGRGSIRAARTATVTTQSATPLRTGNGRAPVLVKVTSRAGGHLLIQQFLLPVQAPGGRLRRPGLLTQTVCDGTSGRVLAPVFGGRRSSPLRTAVSGTGQITETLIGPGGSPVIRRIVRVRGRSVIVSFPARRLPKGSYELVITAVRSPVPQPIVLRAVAL